MAPRPRDPARPAPGGRTAAGARPRRRRRLDAPPGDDAIIMGEMNGAWRGVAGVCGRAAAACATPAAVPDDTDRYCEEIPQPEP